MVVLFKVALCNKNTILPSQLPPHACFFFFVDPSNFSSLSSTPTPSDSADAMPIRSKTPTPCLPLAGSLFFFFVHRRRSKPSADRAFVFTGANDNLCVSHGLLHRQSLT
jgi:hypothetical protein